MAPIHTPPLSEKGAPGQSTQVPRQSHGGRGSDGVGLQWGAPIVSHCVPFIRLIKSCFGAALGFKTRENEKVLRIYGFEGESGGRRGWRRGSTNQIIAGGRVSVCLSDIAGLGRRSERPQHLPRLSSSHCTESFSKDWFRLIEARQQHK